jgi:large subunit ribosomal protein L22
LKKLKKMKYQAIHKNLKMTPRKVRLVANVVRKLTPVQALEMLPHIQKKAALPLFKVIKSAVSNATVKGIDPNTLAFEEIQVQEGPILKRGRAVSRGRWHKILKRTSHIKVVVTQNGKKTTNLPKSSSRPKKNAISKNKASKKKIK